MGGRTYKLVALFRAFSFSALNARLHRAFSLAIEIGAVAVDGGFAPNAAVATAGCESTEGALYGSIMLLIRRVSSGAGIVTCFSSISLAVGPGESRALSFSALVRDVFPSWTALGTMFLK